MRSKRDDTNRQLGFDALLADAEADNRARKLARETACLPSTMVEALPFFHGLLERHHAAMLAGDTGAAMTLRKEASNLALRLNGGKPGILADEDSPGRVLERESAALPGVVPLWGQRGGFIVTVAGMRVRVEMDGVFGIGAGFGFWLGFSAHAVDWDRPFLSETGYRSFLGIPAPAAPGLTPERFMTEVIAAHVTRELKGRLRAIEPGFREGAEGLAA
jgi:hypothetical protein